MHGTDEFKQLFAYNRWATERMLDAASALTAEQLTRDMGNSFPSVRDTLVHIMSAEWVWLSRWQGVSPTSMPEPWRQYDLDEVKREWAALADELRTFIGKLREPDLERTISYRNIAGEPFTTPLSQMLRHVVNHSSYHRGQITTMLRQLGAAAPATDLIVYYRTVPPPGAGTPRP